jgi:hypothetical protein
MTTYKNFTKVQQLVGKGFAFNWEAHPGAIDRISFDSEVAKKIGAVNRTGASAIINRPPRATTTLTTLGGDYSLPGTTQPLVAYQAMSDAPVTLKVTVRAELNLQTSVEELALNNDMAMVKRKVAQFTNNFRNKVTADFHLKMLAQTPQITTQGTSYTTFGGNFMAGLGNAKGQMQYRNGIYANQNDLVLVVDPMLPGWVNASGAQNTFHFGVGLDEAQKEGRLQARNGGFEAFSSPLVGGIALPIQLTDAVVSTAAFGYDGLTAVQTLDGDGNPGCAFVDTLSLALTGAIAGTVIKAGTPIYAATSTEIDWIQPDTGVGIGIQWTGSVTDDATVASDTTVTLNIKGAPIVTGPYKNVTATAAIPTGTKFKIAGAGIAAKTQLMGLGFAPDAYAAVSPDILIPGSGKSIEILDELEFGNGLKVVIAQSVWPGTFQAAIKIFGFYGLVAQKEEAAIKYLYALA